MRKPDQTRRVLVGPPALGFIGGVSTCAFCTAVTESLPKQVRGRAFAVIYATSIPLFGGTTQLVITWLIQVTGSPMAPAWRLLATTAVGQLALIVILATAPAKLESGLDGVVGPDASTVNLAASASA